MRGSTTTKLLKGVIVGYVGYRSLVYIGGYMKKKVNQRKKALTPSQPRPAPAAISPEQLQVYRDYGYLPGVRTASQQEYEESTEGKEIEWRA
jgi:hypothetical protein